MFFNNVILQDYKIVYYGDAFQNDFNRGCYWPFQGSPLTLLVRKLS